jgi:hypothetical protein
MWTSTFLPLLLLVACGEPDKSGDTEVPVETGDSCAPGQDADGDGHCVSEDCDDEDPEVHPGAEERCDGIDNDCDGSVDGPDAVDASSWYLDPDGDGWGTSVGESSACEQPEGTVARAGDCDECDRDVNPGAFDLRDGIDNDCDGSIDGSFPLAESQVIFTGAGEGDSSGEVFTGAGDLNGDGLDDLVLAGPREDVERQDMMPLAYAGKVYLVPGSADLAGSSLGEGVLSLDGAVVNDQVGSAIAGVGDVNGDGLDDLCVVTQGRDAGCSSCGATYLLLGTPDLSDLSLEDPATVIVGDSDDRPTGMTLAGVGDINGDGFDDLLLGSELGHHYDLRWSREGGRAYLFLGSADPSATSMADVDAWYRSDDSYEHVGAALAGAGDVDGDGLDDMLIGVPGKSTELGHGAVCLVLGSSSPATTYMEDADALHFGDPWAHPEPSPVGVGESVAAAGDVNGDGLADFVYGAAGSDDAGDDSGCACLVLGAFSPLDGTVTTADAQLLGEASGDRAGEVVAGVGDLDGDGFDDIAVSAPGHDESGADSGAVYLVLGSPQPARILLTIADAKLTGQAAGDVAGAWLAGAGDTDGDGLDGFLIGAPYNDANGKAAGAVYLNDLRAY